MKATELTYDHLQKVLTEGEGSGKGSKEVQVLTADGDTLEIVDAVYDSEADIFYIRCQ